MSKHKLEYIWLDGYKPTQSLRGKTMIVEDFSGKLEDAKQWSFDVLPRSKQPVTRRIAYCNPLASSQILIVMGEMAGLLCVRS